MERYLEFLNSGPNLVFDHKGVLGALSSQSIEMLGHRVCEFDKHIGSNA